MDLHTWLDLPENAGRAVKLAAALGVTKGAVSMWRHHGVPLDRIPAVARATGGRVSVDAMLRHAMTCRAAKAEAA